MLQGSGTVAVSSTLKEPVLIKVAENFFEVYDCVKLAVFLGLRHESGFVSALQSSDPRASPSKIAFAVMRQWVCENGSAATGPKLFAVLRDDLAMVSVAERFERDLRPTNRDRVFQETDV